MFSALTTMILNPFTSLATSTGEVIPATLVGYIDKSTPDTIIVEHRGGEIINHYIIKFIISTFDDPPVVTTVTKTESDPGPHAWYVGERWVYTSATSLTNKKVAVQVLDTTTNSLLINKVLQNITDFTTPYTQVFDPNAESNSVTETSAQLRMYYSFIKYKYYFSPLPGTVHFVYQEIDSLGNPLSALKSTSPITPLPLDGYYTYPLVGLSPDHRYQYQAVIQWGSSSNSSSFMQFWTFSNARGSWHLDEGLSGGGSTAYDSAQPPTDGVVSGATFVSDIPHSNGYLNLTTENQNVAVPTNHKFDLLNQITVREWINSQPGGSLFYGQLTEIDNASLENISAEWIEPKAIHIDNDVFAVVYRTSIAPGSTITTFHVSVTGDIPQPFEIIDTQTFPVGNYQYNPDILAIGNNIYAVSYGSRYYDISPAGFVMTVSIAPNGTIGDTLIDSYQTASFLGESSHIFLVSGSVYGIAFGGDYSQSYLKQTGGIITISIDNQGHFSPVLYTKKFDERYCSKADVVRVNGNIFAVAYNDDTNRTGCIMTIQIDGNGVVTCLNKITSSISENMQPSIIAGDLPDLFVVAYGGDSGHPLQGVLRMIAIASDGSLGNFTSSLAFPTNLSVNPEIFLTSQNIYLIAYSEGYPGAICHAFTARITDHIEYRDDLVFVGNDSLSPLQGLMPSLVELNGAGDLFLAIYGSGNTSYGFIASVAINFVSSPELIIQKGQMFQVELIDQTVTVTILTSDGYHSVSGTINSAGEWNHIVFTYSAPTLLLYVNSVPSAPVLCSGSLTINTNPIIFGDGFIGYLDEVGIYAIALDGGGVSSDFVSTNHFI